MAPDRTKRKHPVPRRQDNVTEGKRRGKEDGAAEAACEKEEGRQTRCCVKEPLLG